jgi:hypothetical protein
LWTTQQPTRHVGVEVFALDVQMRVAKQSIERFEGRAYALFTRPRARHVHQRESPAAQQGIDGMHERLRP